MTSRLREWLVPAYLFGGLLLGGSSLGVWTNAGIQVAAVAIIALACVADQRGRSAGWSHPLRWMILALFLLICAQLVPLPPGVWHLLPGRAAIVKGDALLGIDTWRPISLSPPDTWEGLATLLPPLAVLLAVVRLRSNSGRRIALAVAAAALANILLGVLQVRAGTAGSAWYLHSRTNVGVTTGFFANGNHLAALLLCVLPLAAGAVEQASAATVDRQRYWTVVGASAGISWVAIAGLLLNGSLFGLAMLAPVAIASVMVAFRHSIGRHGRLVVAVAAILVMIAGVALVVSKSGGVAHDATSSLTSRVELTRNSIAAAAHFFPAGSGAGTFEQVYPMFENPADVDRFFVNHAHNDYLEWAVEGGLPGMVLMALFLWWWGSSLIDMLRDHRATGYAQASGIIGVVLLAHSLIDFPLRTPALAMLFAAATGLMISSRRFPKQRPDLRPVRHVTLP